MSRGPEPAPQHLLLLQAMHCERLVAAAVMLSWKMLGRYTLQASRHKECHLGKPTCCTRCYVCSCVSDFQDHHGTCMLGWRSGREGGGLRDCVVQIQVCIAFIHKCAGMIRSKLANCAYDMASKLVDKLNTGLKFLAYQQAGTRLTMLPICKR